jgi:hypothetical protein
MLPRWTSFAGQSRLVNLETVGLGEAKVGGDTVARVEGDEIAGDEDVAESGRFMAVAGGEKGSRLFVRRLGRRESVPYEVAIVRNKLVERFERLL